VHTDAGAYVTAIAEGRFAEAYDIARRPNPFPSICGRVCAAPCETACRRGAIDQPVSIRALKRFVTEQFGVESFAGAARWHAAHGEVPEATLPSVGIIGGGPAGLAAAHELRLAGHPVTIYEAESKLGGMMVLGIPEYRLPRPLIEREVEAIIELGVDVQTNCRIGVDTTMEELLSRHAAIFVCVGTGRGRNLDIPGNELDGVMKAVEFLLNVNRGYRVNLGKRVVVVGGGNVAFDAARTALRAASHDEAAPQAVQLGTTMDDDARRGLTTTLDAARAALRAGVEHVTVVALESFDEIPAAFEEIEEAEKEGIHIRYRRGPHRVVGEGRVTGLETVGVVSVFDEEHRFRPVFAEGDLEVLEADTVILAVGQAPEVTFLSELALATNRFGGVQVDGDLRSSDQRIWAGGDVAFGPRLLIDAIADGKRAAASIHATLIGEGASSTSAVRINLIAKPAWRRLATDYDAVPRTTIPSVGRERRIGFAEVETGYDEGHAVAEAQRCLRCFDNIMLRPELCILCGLCVDVCPHKCISIVRVDEAKSALLLDESTCIRCGLCINRCPPSALVMVQAQEVLP
jgi:NADPH-dependent glutamate synthase beta subunit-like oxidoreductase/NAD-dependent dihydropyrimidine dehydrogenase PreA subunit